MLCPGKNFVGGITWYSPSFTQPGEFKFCEECYNQFIRNTPLSVYMRNDGIQIATCDFSPSIKQRWFMSVSENNINIFIQYVEPKLRRTRDVRSRLFQLQALKSLESERRSALVTSQLSRRGRGYALDLLSDSVPEYSVNRRFYRGHNSGEVAQLQIQIDESYRKYNSYVEETTLLEHELANLWYNN
ncbi:11428_t:CDS:1 [Dentiscutata heterogama]|uniref:11428_t:CDS:1 n=1 Tax=Dentiscutata heterogama TaxID=1316150 RepID=A0ACA9K2S6_9GLOM|nr:11428_t:CDS:1 [Dentiscutata heterogama]